ncbi:MAG: hypothetical protein ACLSAP_10265 [Oscillospiraceae bacterium]
MAPATTKRNWVFCVLALLLAAAALCGGWLLLRDEPAGNGLAYRPDKGAVDWTQSIGGGDANTGIKIPGYGSLTFPANSRNVPIVLPNPQENTCSFVYKLYLEEESAPIYTSGAIAPGKAVTEITLDRKLPAGSYRMTIQVLTFDLESGAPQNGAEIEAALQVI